MSDRIMTLSTFRLALLRYCLEKGDIRVLLGVDTADAAGEKCGLGEWEESTSKLGKGLGPPINNVIYQIGEQKLSSSWIIFIKAT